MKHLKKFLSFFLLTSFLLVGCSKGNDTDPNVQKPDVTDPDVTDPDVTDPVSNLFFQVNNGQLTSWTSSTFKNALTDNATISISTGSDKKMTKDDYESLITAISEVSHTGLALDFSKATAKSGAMDRSKEDFKTIEQVKTISGFPTGITSLKYSFKNFKNLTSVAKIPEDITEMVGTFMYCSKFNEVVTIPKSVTNLENTFRSCLVFNQPITIPENVIDMQTTFMNCALFNQSITIPESVTDMKATFQGCSVFNQPVTIPKNVTNIKSVFASCSSLASTITVYGAATLADGSAFISVETQNIPLELGPNRTEWSSGNTWGKYTFKSITRVQ